MKNNRHAPEIITSLQNPRVKEVTALQSSSSLRREKGLFVVEGLREVERCLESGFRLRSVFYCPSVCRHVPTPSEGVRVFEVSEAVYGKMAYRGGTEGILAVVCGNAEDRSLEALDRVLSGDTSAPLIVVVESVEKPGNLGAMLRTADASGVRPLQPEPYPGQPRRGIYPQHRRLFLRGGHRLAQGPRHQHPHRPAAGLRDLLRHRHDPPYRPGIRH